VVLPLRITWLGLSSIDTTSWASRISTRPASGLRRSTRGFNVFAGPCRMNPISGLILAE